MAAYNEKSTLLYCNHDSNYPYTLKAAFSQGTSSVDGNYSDITCTGYLISSETNWSSSYNSYLRIYWHDNKENYDRLVSEKAMTGCSKNTEYSTSGTIRVYHKDDGTLSGYAFASFEKGGTSVYAPNNGSISTDWTALWSIARASTPSINGTIYTGTTVTINTNRASSSFTHNLSYSFGSVSGTIATGVGASTTWAIPSNLAAQIPNSEKGTLTITCDTYSGSTYIGTKTYTKDLYANTSIKPSISDGSVTDGNSSISSLNWGVFILGKSYPVVSITASGSQGSSIKEYTFSVVQNSTTTVTKTASTISELNNMIKNVALSAGDALFNLTVKDTRNRLSDAFGISKKIRLYVNPTITDFKVARCKSSSDLTEDDEGTSVKISASGSITDVKNSSNTSVNTLYVKTRYRVSPNGSWSSLTNLPGGVSGYSFDITGQNSKPLAGSFLTTNKYDVELYIYDLVSLSESGWNGSDTPTEAQLLKLTKSQKSILTGFDLMHFHKNGKSVAFGKKSEAGNNDKWFEVRMDKIGFEGNVYLTGGNYYKNGIPLEGGESLPIGSIVQYASSGTPDEGWLLCDGRAISRQTYSDLFNKIGTAFGAGDGSSTFNIPDLRGKVPVGVNVNETEFDALAKTGGEKSHKLVLSETPKHSHTKGTMRIQGSVQYIMFDDGLATSQSGALVWGATGRNRTWNGANGGPAQKILYLDTNNGGWTGSTSEAGSDGYHNNLQPYIALNYIIKASKSSLLTGQVIDNLDGSSTTDAPSIHAVKQAIQGYCNDIAFLRGDGTAPERSIGTAWQAWKITSLTIGGQHGSGLTADGTNQKIIINRSCTMLRISASYNWYNNLIGGDHVLHIFKNGAGLRDIGYFGGAKDYNYYQIISGTCIVTGNFVAGDYIEAKVSIGATGTEKTFSGNNNLIVEIIE